MSISERIKARNKKFKTLSREKQRVAIAEDVLRLIRAEKLVPTRGTYWAVGKEALNYYDERDLKSGKGRGRGTVREMMQKPEVICDVCAIGAVFAGIVDLGVDGRMDAGYVARGAMVEELERFFTRPELDAMEEYFENYTNLTKTDRAALTKLCERIIATKGVSVLPKKFAAKMYPFGLGTSEDDEPQS